jgi:hypothetical protein
MLFFWVGFWKTVVKLNSFDVVIKRFLMELKGEFNWVWIAGVSLLGFQPQRNSGR